MATRNGKAGTGRLTAARLEEVRMKTAELDRLEALEVRSPAEREFHQEQADEDRQCLELSLRKFVRRHFPAATAAAVVVTPYPGGLPVVLPMLAGEVPDAVNLTDWSFR